MVEKVAIFVDYDNVYWGLMHEHFCNPDDKDDNKNLIKKLWAEYKDCDVTTFRVYGDFDHIRKSIQRLGEPFENLLTSLQLKRVQIRHVYSNGKDIKYRKNSADIELSVDAIEHTSRDNSVSKYVFVTSDGDMIPVISRLKYKGKKIDLYFNEEQVAKNNNPIKDFADNSKDLFEFLGIEKKSKNPLDYVDTALNIIYDWHQKHGGDPKLYLGREYLMERLFLLNHTLYQHQKDKRVPESVCEKVLDEIQRSNYIKYVDKVIEGKNVKGIELTKDGLSKIGKSTEKELTFHHI
jgi:uncharacterized LabA/DUF88 family protein